LVIEVVKSENPDYLTINEANTFSADDNKILKDFASKTGFQHYELALSGEYDYHVAAFSKYPLKNIHKLQPLMRACIVAQIETPLGDISIASLHLTPYTEDLRHPEIDLILDYQKQFKHKVLMGDMNSLSPDDGYDEAMIEDFNEMQLKKFTSDGKLRFDAISKILSTGYTDSAVKTGKNREYSAPTTVNEYSAHSNMRLDYIFLSESLMPYLRSYGVVKTELSDKASDHYPVIVELQNP
jgi:exodeoxyribonuclease-3